MTPAPLDAAPMAPSSGAGAGVATLIGRVRQGDDAGLGELLELYRNYLTVLAATRLDARLQPRASPSDIVQETMLRAHQHFGQFRGQSEGELLCWLRQILANNLAKLIERHVLAARRDVRREVSIDELGADLHRSTVQLASLLPAAVRTPASVAEQREEAVLLADRLASLPADYRDVLVLRNIQGLPFEEVSQRMGRTTGACRMLWLRAIERLRASYEGEAPHDP